MDDQKVGRVVRALRRRRRWRQSDLGDEAACSQGMVSLVERGHLNHVSLPVLRRIIAALDASLLLDVRWRAGALDRLLDEEHAALVGLVAERLARKGWVVHVEVTYSRYGEHGSFDILAYMPRTGTVLVIEVKTELASVEATLRKLDEKTRLAPIIARERFAWSARQTARLVVMPGTSTLRRRVGRHALLLDRALSARGSDVTSWLAQPAGPLSGLWFVSPSSRTSAIQRSGGRERVRRSKSRSPSDTAAA